MGWGDKQGGFGKAEIEPGAPGRVCDLSHTCSGQQERRHRDRFLRFNFDLCPVVVGVRVCPRPGWHGALTRPSHSHPVPTDHEEAVPGAGPGGYHPAGSHPWPLPLAALQLQAARPRVPQGSRGCRRQALLRDREVSGAGSAHTGPGGQPPSVDV